MVEEPPKEPVALYDPEGNFTDAFYETLDEDIRGASVLKEAGNPKNLAKMLVHAQRKIGMNKIPLPTEASSEAEWTEFYEAIGRPKTADDYPYKKPEEVPAQYRSDETVKNLRQKAFARNWTLKQWNQFMQDDDAAIVDDIKNVDLKAEADLESAEKKLTDLWGMAYQERIHITNRFINETVPDLPGTLSFSRADFVEHFGRDPMFVEWAATVGKELAEHEVLIAELTQKAPKEAQAELDEIMASDDYKRYLRGEFKKENPTKHEAMLKKITDLHNVIYAVKESA